MGRNNARSIFRTLNGDLVTVMRQNGVTRVYDAAGQLIAATA